MKKPTQPDNAAAKPNATTSVTSPWLQWITGLVLWAVILSLAWIVLAAYQPHWLRLSSLETEIIIILALLLTALILVSVVALRHTRSPEGDKE